MATVTSPATATTGGFLSNLVSGEQYKPGQGQWTRMGTLIALLMIIGYGIYSLSLALDSGSINQYRSVGIPAAIGLVLAWLAYRLVHFPRFADFLISTQAEMTKVNWPGRTETRNATIVVLATCVLMALFLFFADMFWRWILSVIGVLQIGSLLGGGMGM